MRRGIVGLVVAGLVAATAALTGPATAAQAAPSDDAVTYQVNARHDGHAAGPALPSGLSQKWSRELGGNVSYPVIAGGRVFVTVAHTESYGTDLYAFDASSGEQLWGPVDLGGLYGFSSPAYENGRVFTVNFDGQMSAFAAATGQQLWSIGLPGQYAFSSPITPFNGVVYTGGAGGGGTLYAVNEKTGAVLWTAGVANGDHSGPAVDATGVYVSYACQTAYRFSRAGQLIWNHVTGCSGGGGRTPVLHGDGLWIRDSAGMPAVVLSKADGTDQATYSSATAPAFVGAIGLTLNSGTLTGINANTGAIRWSQAGDGQLAGAPVISGRIAYIGSGTGTVFGYDVGTGKQVWSGSAGAPVVGPDEQNATVLQGLAIGNGVLAVPASTRLTIFG